jgi:hypothetical protein
MKRLLCLFFILCAAPVFAGPPISGGGGGSGLFDATTGIATGNATIQKADPALILDGSTAGDTDFWMQVVADEDGTTAGDSLQIGTGTTPGSNSKITVNKDGKVGINTTDFDGTPPAGTLTVKGDTNDGSTLPFVVRDSDEANVLTVDSNGSLSMVSGGVLTVSHIIVPLQNYGFKLYSKDNDGNECIGINPVDNGANIYNLDDNSIVLSTSGNNSGYRNSFTPAGSQTNPTLWITSASAWSSVDEWMSFTHNQTDGVITTGKGALRIDSATGYVGIETSDFDGTPPAGTLTIKGSTNDGSTLPFVVRDSDEANVLTVDSDGDATLKGELGLDRDDRIFWGDRAWEYIYGSGSGLILNGYTIQLLPRADMVAGDFLKFGVGGTNELTDADGEQSWTHIRPNINQSSTAAYNGIKLDVTETSTGDGSTGDGNNLLWMGVGGTAKFSVKNDGTTLIGTSDDDGTPDVGTLTVKGSTNDGSTLPFVVRDSDEANILTVDSNGVLTGEGQFKINGGTLVQIQEGGQTVIQLTDTRIINYLGADRVSSNFIEMIASHTNNEFTDTDGEQSWLYIEPSINQSGTAAWNGIKVDADVTEGEGDGTAGDGNNLLWLGVGGTSKAKVDNAGKMTLAKSVQVAADADSCTADNVGSIRYSADASSSAIACCMQTGAASWAWIDACAAQSW